MLELDQLVRHVVERGVELVADALHRGDRSDGDQRGDQAVLNGGRTLAVLKKLDELGMTLVSNSYWDRAKPARCLSKTALAG